MQRRHFSRGKRGVRTRRHPLGAVRVVQRVLEGRDRHAQAILRTRASCPSEEVASSPGGLRTCANAMSSARPACPSVRAEA